MPALQKKRRGPGYRTNDCGEGRGEGGLDGEAGRSRNERKIYGKLKERGVLRIMLVQRSWDYLLKNKGWVLFQDMGGGALLKHNGKGERPGKVQQPYYVACKFWNVS